MAGHRPKVSFVMATHNRRAVVEHTLARLAECGLPREAYEIIAVDNASTDGTADTIAPAVDTLVRLSRNRGSCAKALGVDQATGRFVVFLDDDSYPRPGSIDRMLDRFEDDSQLAAAGFTVHLPDGRQEGGALPGVFVGCGVGLRTDALRAVGGLDRSFFMQAEEYDLCFRLVGGGWRVEVFDDLHVEHLKTEAARRTDRTTYLDIRNNLRVAARYLDEPYFEIYRLETIQRYGWLAEREGHTAAFRRGLRAGEWLGVLERWRYRKRRLKAEAIERFFGWGFVRSRMAELAGAGVERIVLADLGKNVYAFYQAARAVRVEIAAIGDDRFAAYGRTYRDVPIVTLAEALRMDADAVVVANTSAVHAARTSDHLATLNAPSVHCWFRSDAATRPELATIH